MTIQCNIQLNYAFHALGDESRRKVLEVINNKQQCTAGEIVNLFTFSQPTISKHLKVLEKANLVSRSIEGRHHVFSINPDGLKNVTSWLERHQNLWNSSLDKLDLLLNEQQSIKK
jgi:DNA-binding transcriptional ArsR family regulator